MRLRLSAVAILLVGLGSRPSIADDPAPARTVPWAKDAAALLEGVTEIAAPGALPGSVVAFGPDAFPLVLGGAGGVKRVPMAAAAHWGKGRVFVIAHDAFTSGKKDDVADSGRLLENAIAWAAGAARKPARVGRRVTDLSSIDVLVLSGGNPSEDERKSIAKFVTEGGGQVVGLCPWGWMQVSKAASLAENGLQILLADAGLAFTTETVERTGPKGYLVSGVPGLAFHAERAVELLVATAGKKATGPELVQAALVGQQSITVLPAGEKRIRARIKALLRERAEHLIPTEKSPLRADHPLDRFLLAAQMAELARTPSKDVDAHPAAATFPGLLPPETKSVRRTVDVDLAIPGWHSTGLYAGPGREITVSIPPVTGATPPPLSIRIGCHRDGLWHLDSWPRVPDVTIERNLEATGGKAACAFGGPVYVVVPDGAKGRASVTIEGAVEAPLYVLGVTSKEEWARSRRAPGLWAEIGSTRVILSVPSSAIRDLADPEPLMRFWDRVLDADADLAGVPHERARPERYVPDIEISAGYMHSGYPIMTHLDAAERMVNVELLSTKGDWGLFHEMGHNHQSPDWTFDGTTEVTCNLFALYVLQHVCGIKGIAGHEALVEREKRAADHVKAGAPFSKWKSDPFLALTMYTQLIDGFGWAPFEKAFAAYRSLPPGEHPANDDAKRDQWMTRFSRAVGRNLGPFLQAWGVPTSEGARASIASLPGWMPPGFPPR